MFDHVFDSNSTQKEVYDLAAKPIIDSVLEGFNGTIFALIVALAQWSYWAAGGSLLGWGLGSLTRHILDKRKEKQL